MLARLILCAALLCLTGTAGAHGDCGHLRSAFYEYGALYYKAADGSWTGIDKEVVDEVARRMGCTIEPTTDSRVRIWAGMNGGNIDMSVSTVSTPEREKFGRVIPYLSERNYVLLHQNVPAEVRSIDDFTADHGLRIGVIKSFRHGKFYDAWLTQLRAQGRVYEAADYPALLRLFKVGRVQAMMSISSGWYQLKQEKPPTPLRVMDWAPPKDSVIGGLILSRQHVDEATAERFSQTIRAMREDGTLKRIFERHLNAELAARLLNY
ncbi:transporter substrate-binding domain-containing protein [Pseudoduganella sp. FT25W]|jgi:polar amino acid transport system substrate-binding protein|uniref:Transporter substrate-binding domain-containing protein n=1 Tax=Duganella alba TaxID=2666081 RepID=A0A6L5QJA0_9BURK|nr:transporter substrate-binding domain-containing protein [Duganella alba]MRX09819.1 transporter substrate-binding domain-containing protein [Duganella alba]MRX17456.1 transporter substrate-binding domain-containing protein [Duganella alba]